jgi:hypothetical protein
MDSRIADVIKTGDGLFSDRGLLMSWWQEIADQFYPQRATFTTTRTAGTDYAGHLTTSFTVLCHRDLASFVGSSRPADVEWFKVAAKDKRLKDDGEVQGWTGMATDTMRRAIYDPDARFGRATKEGDKDFAAFGQCAVTVEMNYRTNALLYRNWHLRDVSWLENAEGVIDTVHRNWNPTARNLLKEFKGKCHQEVERIAKEKPHAEIACRHVVMPSDEWDWKKKPKNLKRFPFVCLYIDIKNQHIIDEIPMIVSPWVIPRWETLSDSQYAFSPASMAALPDARLLQAQMLVLLESGQKAVDPPIIAKQELFRGDMNLFAGGTTHVDLEDRNIRDVMMALETDRAGHLTGMSLVTKVEELLSRGWFLNSIFLPAFDPGEKMTAFEVSKRSEEAYRAAVTLFEPIETEYNEPLCSKSFDLLMANGAFGPLENMPDALSDRDVEFMFESPLRQARGRADIARFGEATQITGLGATVDPTLPDNFDVEAAYRDALRGVGGPPTWVRDPREVQKLRGDREQQQAAAKAAEAINAGAVVAGNVGDAALSLREGLGAVE